MAAAFFATLSQWHVFLGKRQQNWRRDVFDFSSL